MGKVPKSVPESVVRLIDTFSLHRESYLSGKYKETPVRREFIDPLFVALGWDIDNSQGYAEAYKDVVHEDAIKVSGKNKAPDYCFRVGGTRKFFLEAKKPSEKFRDKSVHAYQLRRYGWSAKLPISILTDFENLAVYDCRIKPKQTDGSSVARLFIINYSEYIERWDEIASIFSRDAILKGSFDKFAETSKDKKGTLEVDDAFLAEIENWRESLAKTIAMRNVKLSASDLNYAVQMIVDRIVFLRMCEDRGIEEYGTLREIASGQGIYARLVKFFERADDRYNSGLFHFHEEKGRSEPPDTLTPKLAIDDNPLKTIFKNLYYPDSPYEFSVLPAEILGQVYEQFLGKVIRLTAGHRAVVEEKPEVRKSGGVYYTPDYIVNYIVKETVGKLLEKKTPKQAAMLRILDPACGSGSFLIGAYQQLLDWHRDWYVKDGPKKHAKEIFQGGAGQWYLTTAERKRILLNNIFGVDIDPQAVEVTKLSLFLKVLEGESKESLEHQRRMFQERALPDLANNIKCGNSLISPNIYDQVEAKEISADDHLRLNVFDWEKAFPWSRETGGFDAVIGNPPYIRIQRIAKLEADYIFRNYQGPTSKVDLSLVFLEKALDLCVKKGFGGFICSSQWLSTNYGSNLRQVLSGGRLHSIVHFGSLPVFKDADTYPAIFVLSPTPAKSLAFKRITKEADLTLAAIESAATTAIPLTSLSEKPWNLSNFDVVATLYGGGLSWKPLKEFGKAYIGTKCGLNAAFVLDSAEADKLKLEKELLIPYAYRGAEVDRYCAIEPDALIIYPYRQNADGSNQLIPEADLIAKYPNIYKHLLKFKGDLMKRLDSRRLYATGPDWYRHLRSGSFFHINAAKLALKGIAKRSSVGLLPERTAFDGARCPSIIIEDGSGHALHYFMAILNSKLAAYHLQGVCPPKLSGYIEFSATCLTQMPVRVIDFHSAAQTKTYRTVVESVERILLLHKQFVDANTSHTQTIIKNQIDSVDRQIDQLIYGLYGLTKEQIKIVEETID
ncbi:MAG: Eco57I restriction-modification methylase domain-containing protein [Isosphaeraceae bacterium]